VTKEKPPPSLGQILVGPLFNEPMRVETVQANGTASWSVGLVGTNSERFRKVTITAADLDRLTVLDPQQSFNGDGRLLRLALQAYALGIAYEFDPYFGLSISRVDPLPHQLEAISDYLLKLARVRFLLADDAGAGKTIMSGLLIRELELRGLAERNPDRLPGQPRLPMAARTEGEVRHEIPGDEGSGHPRPVWRESMDGTQSGHHVAGSGEAIRNPPRTATGALGSCYR